MPYASQGIDSAFPARGSGPIPVGRLLSAFALALALAGCALPTEAPVETKGTDGSAQVRALGQAASATAAAQPDERTLAFGERVVLAEGIVGAENLLLTSDGRLLVSGDEGIFELRMPSGESGGPAEVARHASGAPCAFGGLAEWHGVVYANCYDHTDSFLYAAHLEPNLNFIQAMSLPGIQLANGLVAHPAGRLLVAGTLSDQILRVDIDPVDPLSLAAPVPFVAPAGLAANGLALYGDTLFWSDGFFIKASDLDPDGEPGPVRTLVSRLTFFDDLDADARGLLVADYLGGALRLYDLNGRFRGPTVRNLEAPSSALRIDDWSGLGPGAVVVTERGPGRVTLLRP